MNDFNWTSLGTETGHGTDHRSHENEDETSIELAQRIQATELSFYYVWLLKDSTTTEYLFRDRLKEGTNGWTKKMNMRPTGTHSSFTIGSAHHNSVGKIVPN